GLAFVVIAIAALYLGLRANFDPTIGPARLLYAFEAVIIGGIGSFWGTLAGGIVLGLAQTIGAHIDPEWQILAGHLAFLVVLVLRPRGLIQDLIFLFYMLALAQCWNLLAGYAGLISVGQQAFVGLGGYLLFALTLLGGINPLLAIPIAGVVSALFALPTALIMFRLRGAYFAIGTRVVAEVYRL